MRFIHLCCHLLPSLAISLYRVLSALPTNENRYDYYFYVKSRKENKWRDKHLIRTKAHIDAVPFHSWFFSVSFPTVLDARECSLHRLHIDISTNEWMNSISWFRIHSQPLNVVELSLRLMRCICHSDSKHFQLWCDNVLHHRAFYFNKYVCIWGLYGRWVLAM